MTLVLVSLFLAGCSGNYSGLGGIVSNQTDAAMHVSVAVEFFDDGASQWNETFEISVPAQSTERLGLVGKDDGLYRITVWDPAANEWLVKETQFGRQEGPAAFRLRFTENQTLLSFTWN